jgi:anaerobic selenocysteine-containing dehydrogenase
MPAVEAVVPRAMVGRDTLRVIAGSTIFTGGGTMAHDTQLLELRTPARATIHPQTAATMQLVRGDAIDVAGPEGGRLEGLIVALDENVPQGAAVLVDGIPGTPLNVLGGAPSVHVTKRAERLEAQA